MEQTRQTQKERTDAAIALAYHEPLASRAIRVSRARQLSRETWDVWSEPGLCLGAAASAAAATAQP